MTVYMPVMGVGRGVKAHLVFEEFRKKDCFLVSSGKKQNSPLLAPQERCWKTPLVPPLEKSF